MKCKNCGHLIWRATERDYAPSTPTGGLTYYTYWHDWKEKGVYHTCSCKCEKPEPEASRGSQKVKE